MWKKMKRTWCVLLTVLFAVSLLCACAKEEPTETSASAETSSPTEEETEVPTTAAPAEYKVIFDLNGGELVSGELEQTVLEGAAAVAPEVSNGYKTLTWSEDFSDVKGDMTIIAQWEKREMSSTEVAAYGQKCTVTVNVETITGYSETGSGFFIDNEGTIVTAYHVIDLPAEITVEVSDGGTYPLETVIAFSPVYDLAIIKIDYQNPDYLEFADSVAVGEPVYAVGSALGELPGSFTAGMVSSVKRKVGKIECIQTDAAISEGNSGGPLMNAYGEVVGMNCFSYINGENLNLAVKNSMLDNIGEERNFTMNEMREWYEKESSRSYSPYKFDEEKGYTFYYSLVNTYTTVTGKQCEASLVDGEGEEGYHDGGTLYLYDYDIENYDKYLDYLKNQGFVFDEKETADGIEYNYYLDEKEGLTMELAIDQSSNNLYVSVYYD